MGVAFWILPRLRVDGRPTRGREAPMWLAYGALNAGILGAAATSLVAPAWTLVLVLARMAEVLAVALFAWHAWPRVRPAGNASARGAGGECARG